MPFTTAACADFYAHWRRLAGGALLPHTRAFIDDPPLRLMRHALILELDREGAAGGLFVRFLGTGLATAWGEDFTGTYLEARMAQQERAASCADVAAVCGRPAGLCLRGRDATSHGRAVAFEAVWLPLAVDAGKPARCVAHVHPLAGLEHDERKAVLGWSDHPLWLDLGAGVPGRQVPGATRIARAPWHRRPDGP